MPLLFSYGTLQQDNVQLSTFGRLLNGHPDQLVGFEQSLLVIDDPQVVATSGKTHHVIVKHNGRDDSRVNGTVFEITDADLANADRYEVSDTSESPPRSRQESRRGCNVDARIEGNDNVR